AQGWPLAENRPTHVTAPASFIGDKLSSYCQNLVMVVQARSRPAAYGGHRPVIMNGNGKFMLQLHAAYCGHTPVIMNGNGKFMLQLHAAYCGYTSVIMNGNGKFMLQLH
ncbi:unnamed protein product, partial [Owenia fusiformis]